MKTKFYIRLLVVFFLIGISSFLFYSCGDDKPNPVQTSDTPQIIKITPDTINIGGDITITGKNFGTNPGKVNFKNDSSNIFRFWTDTLIKLQIPYKALSGNVSVTNSSGTSNEVYLKILNENYLFISSINPVYVLPNDTVTIKGVNFGNIMGKITYYDTKYEKIVLWSDTLVKFIYSGIGTYLCIINNFNYRSYFQLYEIIAPQITSIYPLKLYSGMILTIKGNYFDSISSNSNVKFNNFIASEYLFWNNNNIKVRVPDNVTSGYLTVNKPRISSKQFEYEVLLQPIIENITPQFANIGDKITISGKNFGNLSSSVLLNWRPAQIVNWSDNLIEAIVPDSCTCGDVFVISSDTVYSKPYDYKLKDCGSRAEFNKLNKVKVEGMPYNIDTTYIVNNDSIYINYDQPNIGGYYQSVTIILILYPGSLNIKYFRVGYSKFIHCLYWTCYDSYLLEGIDIPLNSYSQLYFKFIIDNQHPEKFILAATESGNIDFDPKQGQYFYITRGIYDIKKMKPIIITFYKE